MSICLLQSFWLPLLLLKKGKQALLEWHMLFETAEQFAQVVKTFKADEGLKQNVEKLDKFLDKFYQSKQAV
jgi:hypothetical protein